MNYIQCYLEDLSQTLNRLPEDRIDQVVQILHEARLNNRQVFIMGNGGAHDRFHRLRWGSIESDG